MLIELSKISADSAHNSRKGESGIQSLVKSMKENGLILPIAVRSIGRGAYEIIDGHRRFAAATQLGWPEIEASVREDADGLTSATLSLAANIERLPLHVVDQLQAFAKLKDAGLAPKDIARKFAISAKQVSQVLALGNLHSAVLQAWKEDKFSDEVAQAFTLGTPAQQFEILSKLKKARSFSPWEVKRLLKVERAGYQLDYVGEKKYLQEGGEITIDLFASNKGEARLVSDKELLDILVSKKLEEVGDQLIEKGFAGMMRGGKTPNPDLDYDDVTHEFLKDGETDPPVGIEWLDDITEPARRKLIVDVMLMEDGVVVELYREAGERSGGGADEPRYADHDDIPKPEARLAEVPESGEISRALEKDVLAWRTDAYRGCFRENDHAFLNLMVTAGTAEYCTAFHFSRPLDGRVQWASLPAEEGDVHTRINELALVYANCIETSAVGEQDMLHLASYLPTEELRGWLLKTFKPDEYFERCNGKAIRAALVEMRRPANGEPRKADLVKKAVKAAIDTGWLPPLMRLGVGALGFEPIEEEEAA